MTQFLSRFLISIFVSLLLFACKGKPLTAFEEDGKYGYKDQNGKVVVSPQYSIAFDYREPGVAFAFGEKGWVCIDQESKILLNVIPFDNGPDEFSEGLARFSENGKVGFFDSSCKKVIAADFDFAFPFEKGYSVVCKGCQSVAYGEHSVIEGGLYGVIDPSGKIRIGIEYDSILEIDAEAKVVSAKKKSANVKVPLL